jgi:type IV secretion system protein VirB1
MSHTDSSTDLDSRAASRSIRHATPNCDSSEAFSPRTWELKSPFAKKATNLKIGATLAGALLVVGMVPASAHPMRLSEFRQLAVRCAPTVESATLASIAKAESSLQPLAIHDNTSGLSGAPATLSAAVDIAAGLIAAGHSLDLGIMQVNSGNLTRFGLTPRTAFDVCRSMAVGASILSSDYTGGSTHLDQQAALRSAISRYNTGDAKRGFTNGYVQRVELVARQVVPAIDVDALPPAMRMTKAFAPATSSGPYAPADWDLWASFDYTAAHAGKRAPVASSTTLIPGQAVLADAGEGPTAAAFIIDPPDESN